MSQITLRVSQMSPVPNYTAYPIHKGNPAQLLETTTLLRRVSFITGKAI